MSFDIGFNPHYLFALFAVIAVAGFAANACESMGKRDIAVACVHAGSSWNDKTGTCEAKK